MDIVIKRRKPVSQPSFSSTIHPVLQTVYAARGASCDEDLDTSLGQLLPPHRLKGMNVAVSILVAAVQQKKRILIVGDFDADGATSTAFSMLALGKLGATHVDYLVPNRFEFGYGLTPEIVAVSREKKPDLIVTVDNGISSIDGVKAARDCGIQVLVTDHHLPGTELPDADAIVNPNQPGCLFPSKNLAGVGVIFYVMTALRTRLRELGWFCQKGIPVPNMADFLDLVALGTVADVVPLDQNNRTLVYHGLRRIRAGHCRPGIKALAEVGKRDLGRLVAADLGFSLGPRVNAAGRLEDMSFGIECLLEQNASRAREMALELDQLNTDRRRIEAGMHREALGELKQLDLRARDMPFGLCLYKKSWHQGVVGILASRIREKLHRPVIAFALAGEGELKGSGRSIPGFHIRDALDAVAVKYPGLVIKFGGHAMAAGLSLSEENYPAFMDAFDQVVRQSLTGDDLAGKVYSDGELASADTDLPLAKIIREAGPWGQGFPEPVFDGEFEILSQRIVGEKHLKLVLGIPGTNRVIDGIAFNIDTESWPDQSASRVQIAYRLDVNEFRKVENPQLVIEVLKAVK